MQRWHSVQRVLRRNRYEIGVWSASAVVLVVGWVAAALLVAPAIGLGGTLMAGFVRLGIEIGRRERVADVREQLTGRAAEGIAAAVNRHVFSRVLWTDEALIRELKRRIIEGGPPREIRQIPAWTLDGLVEDRDTIDIRERTDIEWLRIASELQKGHDDFASAVGPYMADLGEDPRRLVAGCLRGLEDAKKAAERAFVVLYAPGGSTDEQIADAGRIFHQELEVIHTAANKLSERQYR